MKKNSQNSKYNLFKIMLDIFVLFNEGSKFSDDLIKSKIKLFRQQNGKFLKKSNSYLQLT